MGHYIGLRFKAKLLPRAHMALVVSDAVRSSPNNNVPFWEIVRSQGIKIPDKFRDFYRNTFIPYGAGGLLTGWSDQKSEILEGGVWDVVCYSKDIEMTRVFCKEVLPLLVRESCTAELLFEDWKEPEFIEAQPCVAEEVGS